MLQRIVTVDPGYTTDGGTGSLLDTVGDIAVLDVRHLACVEVFVNQINDAGTVTLEIERTVDGVNWDPVATAFTEASFPAGANKAQSVLLVDSNGMPILATQVRVRTSAIAGGGTYTVQGYGQLLCSGEKIIALDPTYTTDPGGSGTINATGDACEFDVTGLTNIDVILDQITDPGVSVVALTIERTIDGTNWDEIATKADTDFPAGANVSTSVPFSGTGGKPMHAKKVRVRCTNLTGGVFNAHVIGKQIPGYR